jgi:predicted TIM-barrel fold metal-dependent hydrolase
VSLRELNLETMGETARWCALRIPWLKGLYDRLEPVRRQARRYQDRLVGRCTLRLADYCPRSTLVTPVTMVTRPRFPVIDAHNHLVEEFKGLTDYRPAAEMLDIMDEVGVEMVVDMDGGWGEDILNRHLDHFKHKAPDRFQVFAGVDWSRWAEEKNGFGEWSARRLEAQLRRGAQGLKIWKVLGLTVVDDRGARVPINDERLDALWARAAECKAPVVIHIADPVALFLPPDSYNERYEEMCRYPDLNLSALLQRRGATAGKAIAFDTLIKEFADLVARHPATTFIGAHVGCYAENLAWVGQMLEQCSNFYVDISARISQLGRQPYAARRFFLQYPDRILFGTDLKPDPAWYRIYYRFLETADEYFDYGATRVPMQGRWCIYGVNLPDEVLEKVYRLNARRVLMGNPLAKTGDYRESRRDTDACVSQ